MPPGSWLWAVSGTNQSYSQVPTNWGVLLNQGYEIVLNHNKRGHNKTGGGRGVEIIKQSSESLTINGAPEKLQVRLRSISLS